MAAINELATRFSFVGSLKPLEGFNKNLGASIGLLAGASTAIVGATAGFIAWTTSVTESIDPMVQLSRETDVSISAIQELGYAASQNGSSLEAVESSLSELTKRAGEFARTGGGSASEAFLQLGVSVRDSAGKMKTADKIMMDVQKSIQGFSKGEQADILDKLGIDSSMIQLMNQSAESIQSLRDKAKALSTVTKEQANAAASLNDANTTLKFGLQGLQNQIAVGVAPVIESITGGFIDFLMVNKDLIQNGIKKLGVSLINITGFIKRMAPVALGVAAAFGIWQVANIGVAASLAAIFSPVVLITAGIAGIALVIDDLIVAFNGGNSVIRDFIQQWLGFDIAPMLQAGVKAITDFAASAFERFIAIRDLIFGIFSGIGDIWSGDFSKGFSKIGDSLMGFVDMIKGTFTAAFKFIADQFLSILPEWAKDFISGDGGEKSPQGFSGGNNGAVDKGVTNNSTSSATVTQNNNINVHSNDPQAAGAAVAGYQDQQLRDARQYYYRGGM